MPTQPPTPDSRPPAPDVRPPTSDLRPPTSDPRPPNRAAVTRFAIFAGAILLLFHRPLADLVRLSLKEELHSHLILIPVVSAYLLWIRRQALPSELRASPAVAMLPFVLGAAAWTAPLIWQVDPSQHLALMTVSFLLFLLGGGFLFLGARWMRAAAFPLAFLLFMVPLPDRFVNALETASKLASAEAADLFFSVAGMSYLREGNTFTLPGITLEVAQECSGIRSSLVLFITGVFAANLLLQTTWRRWVLVLVVIPIGILRNGFRILTLGYLSVHVGPHILDSPIHHRGGPIFFLLSLIPLVAIIWWLKRGERNP